MADAETARLCSQVVHTHFGPLTANVATVLLHRGRLSFPQLLRYTRLKPRTVRAAVLVLVQYNLLWHAQTDEEGDVLEFNTTECLKRLRFGRSSGYPHVYSQALYKLVSESYLKPSTLLSHQSPRDKRIKYEAEEKAKLIGFPTARQLREAKAVAEARLKREEEEAERVGLSRDQLNHRSSKKKVAEEVVDVSSSPTIYFRVNLDKFDVHIRNKLIEKAVEERFNRYAALVMKATLMATESKQKLLSDTRSDPCSTNAIAMHIPDDEDLSAVKEYLRLMANADNPTLAGRAASFLSHSDNKVYVEFDTIGRRLRRRVLESVARERHGEDAVRIVRLLLDVGKMDEKQVRCNCLQPKDVRRGIMAMLGRCCPRCHPDCLISTQEIAKSADHNPTRTAYSTLLSSLYKTLFNIGARRQAEQEEPEIKAVPGKMRAEKLGVLEMRVEEAVFILRDFAPGRNSDE
ncbi:hypothetical protein BKA83DRAFT_4168435 [Pisolithus microcarpus]|nr:hypothetical protein BKA83DRAFT_4168435 [Pisolithus microcarpus]